MHRKRWGQAGKNEQCERHIDCHQNQGSANKFDQGDRNILRIVVIQLCEIISVVGDAVMS